MYVCVCVCARMCVCSIIYFVYFDLSTSEKVHASVALGCFKCECVRMGVIMNRLP